MLRLAEVTAGLPTCVTWGFCKGRKHTPNIAVQESAVVVGHWLSVLFKGLRYLRWILALCEEIQWNCDIHFFIQDT